MNEQENIPGKRNSRYNGEDAGAPVSLRSRANKVEAIKSSAGKAQGRGSRFYQASQALATALSGWGGGLGELLAEQQPGLTNT